jgi:hypothetical protein
MASPIERNVIEDISRLACRAEMASRPETPWVTSWGKPGAVTLISAPHNTINLFNIEHLPLVQYAVPMKLTEQLFDDTLLSKVCKVR